MRDFGYDVADYRDVDPVFGTLADFDRLIAEAHARGLRVLLDFVPNHTSSDHPWFVDARSSRDAPNRDWYVWRDPAPDGGPPNDWCRSSAAGVDPRRGDRPVLLPLVPARAAGPRLAQPRGPRGDARRAALLVRQRHRRVPDRRPVDDRQGRRAVARRPDRDGPGTGGDPRGARARRRAGRWRRGSRSCATSPTSSRPGARRRGLHAAAAAGPLLRRRGRRRAPAVQLRARHAALGRGAIRAAVGATRRRCPASAWPNWVLGNHDQPRVASRLGAGQARVAAMLLLTLVARRRPTTATSWGRPTWVPADRIVDVDGRDPERSPMPWTRDARHGEGSRRRAVAADDRRSRRGASRPSGPIRDRCSPSTGGCSRCAAPSRPCTPGRGRRSPGRARASSRSTGPAADERVRVLLNLTATPIDVSSDARLGPSRCPPRRPGGARASATGTPLGPTRGWSSAPA